MTTPAQQKKDGEGGKIDKKISLLSFGEVRAGKRSCCMNMRDNAFLRDDVKMLKQSIRKTLHILSLMLRVLQPSLPHHLHGSKSRRQEQIQLIQNVSKIVIIWRVHVLVEASKLVGDFLLFPFIFSPSSFRYQSEKRGCLSWPALVSNMASMYENIISFWKFH